MLLLIPMLSAFAQVKGTVFDGVNNEPFIGRVLSSKVR